MTTFAQFCICKGSRAWSFRYLGLKNGYIKLWSRSKCGHKMLEVTRNENAYFYAHNWAWAILCILGYELSRTNLFPIPCVFSLLCSKNFIFVTKDETIVCMSIFISLRPPKTSHIENIKQLTCFQRIQAEISVAVLYEDLFVVDVQLDFFGEIAVEKNFRFESNFAEHNPFIGKEEVHLYELGHPPVKVNWHISRHFQDCVRHVRVHQRPAVVVLATQTEVQLRSWEHLAFITVHVTAHFTTKKHISASA